MFRSTTRVPRSTSPLNTREMSASRSFCRSLCKFARGSLRKFAYIRTCLLTHLLTHFLTYSQEGANVFAELPATFLTQFKNYRLLAHQLKRASCHAAALAHHFKDNG